MFETVLLASRNPGKLVEVSDILRAYDSVIEIVVQAISERTEFSGADVEETGNTFIANALIKARWAAATSGLAAMGDDSGLEVDALGGAPGVYSARFAGVSGGGREQIDVANNAKLVAELQDKGSEADWSARFKCAVVIFSPDTASGAVSDVLRGAAIEGDADLLERADGQPVRLADGVALACSGVLEGMIITEPRGKGGFGYDPYFFLPQRGCTTAELSRMAKNAISHRGQAFRMLANTILSLAASAGHNR